MRGLHLQRAGEHPLDEINSKLIPFLKITLNPTLLHFSYLEASTGGLDHLAKMPSSTATPLFYHAPRLAGLALSPLLEKSL
jgi:hypothetical protein